jgi:hypothetical protein
MDPSDFAATGFCAAYESLSLGISVSRMCRIRQSAQFWKQGFQRYSPQYNKARRKCA